MEDETGTVNVIGGRDLVEPHRKESLGALLLGVYGVWHAKGVSGIWSAKRLVDLSHLLGHLWRSPDFG